jgi:hypothetical protein
MAYRDQRFIGVVDADSIVSTNFIIGSGNFASGSNLIADVDISSGDETLIRPGQIIFSVAGAVPAGTTVQSVNEDYTQITLNQQATSTAASDTFGLSTPSGSYLFQSASFNDPNNALSVNDVSGSDSGSNFAIVGVAKRNNATRNNVFHLYRVSEVVQRNIGSSEISFFIEWGEQGTESGSGDILQTAEKEVAIIDLTDTGSIAPGFSLGIAGMETVKAGSEYAGYNIAITQYLSDLSGSAGGGTTATGSFTGSFTGSLLGDVLGTASIADFATTASYALSASVEITKEVSSSLADTASFAQSGDGAFSGVFSGSNYSTEFTFDGDTLIVSGNVFVDGTLDAATKNFKIQHPTMDGYYLLHSSLEGPERGIYHRGKLSVSNIIHLPDYWKELPVDETDMTVQLTPIGNNCQHWVKRVTKETVEIECECGKPNCYYIIHAQRYNEGKFEILEPKRNKSL